MGFLFLFLIIEEILFIVEHDISCVFVIYGLYYIEVCFWLAGCGVRGPRWSISPLVSRIVPDMAG